MSIEKRQLALGGRLRRLRAEAGFATGKDFARQLGWIASKVSRVEKGRTLPSDADVLAWSSAVGASEKIAKELSEELLELRLARDSWKRQLRTGHAHRQRYNARLEQGARQLTMVEFFLVPGLVQTPEYARAVFEMASDLHQTPEDSDEAVRERVRRQDVLYAPNTQIDILMAEAALRYPICSPPVLRAQIDRLVSLGALPNVRIGVIPLGTTLPTITMHGYVAIDDMVHVEVNHTEISVTEPEDLDLYRRITDRLWTVALEGDEARELLSRVLGSL